MHTWYENYSSTVRAWRLRKKCENLDPQFELFRFGDMFVGSCYYIPNSDIIFCGSVDTCPSCSFQYCIPAIFRQANIFSCSHLVICRRVFDRCTLFSSIGKELPLRLIVAAYVRLIRWCLVIRFLPSRLCKQIPLEVD